MADAQTLADGFYWYFPSEPDRKSFGDQPVVVEVWRRSDLGLEVWLTRDGDEPHDVEEFHGRFVGPLRSPDDSLDKAGDRLLCHICGKPATHSVNSCDVPPGETVSFPLDKWKHGCDDHPVRSALSAGGGGPANERSR